MNQEYKINTLSDFLKVPHEKQAECLRDFSAVLDSWRHQSMDSELDSFVWVDDGKVGISGIRYLVNGVEVARTNGGEL